MINFNRDSLLQWQRHIQIERRNWMGVYARMRVCVDAIDNRERAREWAGNRTWWWSIRLKQSKEVTCWLIDFAVLEFIESKNGSGSSTNININKIAFQSELCLIFHSNKLHIVCFFLKSLLRKQRVFYLLHKYVYIQTINYYDTHWLGARDVCSCAVVQ